jgi:dUTP pyrophosphatase
MNVNIERGLRVEEEALNAEEREQFENLLNIMGTLGGYDPETFELEKEAILNSGISLKDFASILGENFNDKIGPREIADIKIQKLTETAIVPKYAHETDACADLYADETINIQPGQTVLISTGIAMAIPEGYVVHVYPRSSIGAKTPLRLSNSVGVIDSGYRDELKIIYTNTGNEIFTVNKGERIAQMSLDHSPMARFELVDDVKEYGEDRMGGIGSTGVN